MTQAIFLSYASQDAVAARRICDVLRAAGLEVWFDQSELRGGDAWDQSIRKQIKECALFVPVISVNTQARAEGYFRLEWRLADQRTHLMAKGMPFILPVTIDSTSEAGALVPDAFMEVQWTKLSDEASIAAFSERVSKLLDGSGAQTENGLTGAPDIECGGVTDKPELHRPHASAKQIGGNGTQRGAHPANDRPRIATTKPHPRRYLILGATAMAAMVGAIAWWRPWGHKQSATETAPQDPDLTRAISLITSLEVLRGDSVLAEDLVKAVLAKRPTDTDAIVAMARVQTYILLRGYDRTEERFQQAKTFVDRALAVAPKNAYALSAASTYFYIRRAELERAAELSWQAIALAPNEPLHYRILSNVLAVTPGVSDDTLIEDAKKVAARFPQDALAQYELARHYRDRGNITEADKYFALAVQYGPVINAAISLARHKLFIYNDAKAMKAMLDGLPEKHRTTDRAAYSYFAYAMLTGEFEVGIESVRQLSDPWMSDFDYTGPAKLLMGELLLMQGKTELAQLRFQEAREELSKRKPVLTRNFNTVWLEAIIAWRLGDKATARKRNALVFSEMRRPWQPTQPTLFSPMVLNFILSERMNALALMREAVNRPAIKTMIRTQMRLDPRMAPFRNDTEVAKILAD